MLLTARYADEFNWHTEPQSQVISSYNPHEKGNTMSDQIPLASPEPSTDAWTWRAVYDDAGQDILDEHEADGTPHKFSEIELDRLRAFILIPNREGLLAHAVHLEPEHRLIFFRRTRIVGNGPEAGTIRKAHVIGYQQTIAGQNVQSLTAVFDNGATLSCSDQALIEP